MSEISPESFGGNAVQSIHNNALQLVMLKMEAAIANSDLSSLNALMVERMLERVIMECRK